MTVYQEISSVSHKNTSYDEEAKIQVLEQQPSTSQAQFVLHVYMQYIDDPTGS